ncbi:MAG: hypothetical protein KUG77_07730 [Nannocystaceae bacterium]|nr:hypothetical protein [Nannocystaceae bacterium]
MMRRTVQKGWLCGWVMASMALFGCGSESASPGEAGTSGSGGAASTGVATTGPAVPSSTSSGQASTEGTSAAGESSSEAGGETSSGGGTSTGGPFVPGDPLEVLCGTAPPQGAELPPPLPEPSGACPPFIPGWNTFSSSGNARDVLVVAPSDLAPDEQLPVAVLWHWLGGSAESFVDEADVQDAVNQFRFLALVPAEKGDLLFRWPFSAVDTDERMQEEFVFFDDMLACAAQTYPVDNTCVSSVGVSAGALFASQLGWGRSEYLSSIVVLSGGTGGGLVKPWNGAEHIMPAMVLWGGPADICVALNFTETSENLEDELMADGHAVVECEHNCGHSAPPFESGEPDLTPYAGMWKFFLDHPYWLEDGETPWEAGTPSTLPEWCSVGIGSSTPREGICPDGGGC